MSTSPRGMTATTTFTTLAAAVRAEEATKVYGSGSTAVRARRREPGDPRAALHRHHGAVRLRQVHPHALHGRARQPDLRPHLRRRPGPRHPVRQGASPARLRPRRVRVPGVQPAADAQRGREHHAPARPRRPQGRSGLVRPRGRHRRPGRPAAPPPVRAVGRPAAARRRGPRPGQPARGDLRRRADRQPRLPQRGRDPRPSCAGPSTTWARPSSWSPTTPGPPPTPTRSCSWPTAGSSTSSPPVRRHRARAHEGPGSRHVAHDPQVPRRPQAAPARHRRGRDPRRELPGRDPGARRHDDRRLLRPVRGVQRRHRRHGAQRHRGR